MACASGVRSSRRAVGVGARQHDHVEPVQARCQAALRQRMRQREQGLGAGRLVAMLLADQQHGGAARGAQGGRVEIGLA